MRLFSALVQWCRGSLTKKRRGGLAYYGAVAAAAIVAVVAAAAARTSSQQNQFLQAIHLEQKDNPAAALAQYQAVLQRIPARQTHSRAALYYRIGECLWKLDRGDDAFAAFRKAAETDPSSILAQLRLAQLYLAGGSVNHALEHAQLVLAQAPENPDAWTVIGSAHASLNQLNEASRAYVRALDSDPGRVAAAVALAEIYANENRPQDARAVLHKAAAAQPSNSVPLLALARLEEEEGNNAAAEHDYRLAVVRDDSNETNLRLAQFLERNARTAEAEQVLRRRDAVQPQRATFLADFQFLSGRPFLAMHRYLAVLRGELQAQGPRLAPQRLPSRAPGVIAARLIEADLETPNSTSTEMTPNRADSAIVRARRHLDEFGNKLDPVTHEILSGEIALAEGNLEQAAKHAANALAHAPQSSAAHYLLGVSRDLSGQPAEARNEWEAALALEASFIPARLALARQALQAGAFDTAEEEVLPVVREEPGNLAGLLTYAGALSGEGRYDDAVSVTERALAITEANPGPRLVLGEIALREGRFAAALLHFERALVIDVHCEPAVEGLIRTYRHGRITRASLRHMEQLGEHEPPSPTILELVGRLYADHGFDSDAARVLKRTLALDPARGSAAEELARVYVREGNLARAKAALTSSPGTRAQLVAATDADQQGQADTAIRAYEQLVREGEPSGIAANNLAWLYANRREKLDRALLLAQSAHDKAPQNAAFLDTLGFVHLQRREYSKAAEIMKRASDLAANAGIDSATATAIQQHLAQARHLAGEAPLAD